MEQALWACDITNWYQNPVLAKVTFPTRFVDIPERFVARLLESDGLFARTDEAADFGEWSDSEWSGEEAKTEVADKDEDERRDKQQETFPEFEAAIKAAIDRWTISGAEGGLFPRLNWSSPLDAHWMGIGGSLRCTTVPEVLRFLEASDAVRSDLEQIASFQALDATRAWKPKLALRKWHDFHTPNEFRCFVKQNHLIAISQKDITNFWPFLVESRNNNLCTLDKFFNNTIKGSLDIEDYVFDAYIHSNGKALLIDISPFHEAHIEPLLWTWEELAELATIDFSAAPSNADGSKSTELNNLPPMRIIETETNIMPNLKRMTTALPFDLLQPQLPAGVVDTSPDEEELDGVNPNDIEALVARLQKISAAAEKLNEANSTQ